MRGVRAVLIPSHHHTPAGIGPRNCRPLSVSSWRSGLPTFDHIQRIRPRVVFDPFDRARPAVARACLSAGIDYRKRPLGEDVPPNGPLLAEVCAEVGVGNAIVHCWAGRHRTGSVALAVRRTVDGTDVPDALAELFACGFGDPGLHPNLWSFIRGLC
jgi:hypothetical protein